MHPNQHMPEDYKYTQDPVQAPEGYFEQFNSRLAERLPVKKRRNRYWAISAAAAVLIIPALFLTQETPPAMPPDTSLASDTLPVTPGLRLDDETLASYLQQPLAPATATAAGIENQPEAPVSNASFLTEEDLLRAGLLRAEEFETMDPML